jgi:catechol 2,3-dioxygenase-like lactoylglutathione lyase family enzyme
MSVGTLWVGALVIDCRDLARMIEFWREALHYVPREPADADGVVLKDPAGTGPNVSLNRTNDPPLADYRLHLDLYSSDPPREVARLVRLGARVTRPASPGEDFVTLADPDGNVFDVVEKRGWSFGQRS